MQPPNTQRFGFVVISAPVRTSLSSVFHRSKSKQPCWRSSNRPIRIHPTCVGASTSAQSDSSTDSLTTQPQTEASVTVPPFRLQAADILVLAVFFLSFLLPALRTTRPPRAHAIFSATLFTLGSALYVLRQRSIHRKYTRQLITQPAPDTSDEFTAQLIEARTTLVEDAEITRGHISRSDRARDKQHKELLRAFRSDLEELQAGFSLVQDALIATNTEEIAQLRAQVRQRDLDTGRLQAELNQARADAESATQRESVARTEADAFRTAASEAASLRERLIAAQTRTAALEERLDRAQNAVLAPQQQPQQDQQVPGGRVLRDALFNLGKNFPPAGRLLFDSVPPENTRQNDLGSPPPPPPPPPPLAGTSSWPDRALGEQAPPQDLGIPKDGGFGINLFKKDQSDAGDPFSAMRGAFNQNSSTASLPQSEDAQKSPNESSPEQTVDKDDSAPNENSEQSLVEKGAASETAAEEQDETEKKFRNQNDSVEEKRVEDAPVESTGPTKVTGETRWEKARQLVKRARAAPRNEAERLFATAVELLEAAPGGGLPRDAELGSALLAWARNDVAADGAKARLERAAGLLRPASGDDTAKFNLALTLCMLASMENPPNCDPLYAEACEWYEQLTPSRTVCFNAGLAYIARARLASDDSENTDESVQFYNIARDRFASALNFAPDDSKSQAYVAECDAKIVELAT